MLLLLRNLRMCSLQDASRDDGHGKGIYNEKGDIPMDKYEVGDIVRLKKQHPCGSSEWEILRVGADFRLKCLGCGHQVMLARKLVEKNTKEIRKKS